MGWAVLLKLSYSQTDEKLPYIYIYHSIYLLQSMHIAISNLLGYRIPFWQINSRIQALTNLPQFGPHLTTNRYQFGPKLFPTRLQFGPKLASNRAQVGPILASDFPTIDLNVDPS